MKHLISNNPFAQKLKSRVKAPMRVWWKNNKLVVAEEAARTERDDIGKKGKVAARLYAALSVAEKVIWERRAADESKLPVDQCFMYVSSIMG